MARRMLQVCLGVGCAIAAVVVHFVSPFDLSPLFPFYPAVFAAAILGGVMSGITCLFLSTVAGWFFFVPVRYSFVFSDASGAESMIMFVLGSALAIYLCDAKDRAVTALMDERNRSTTLFAELQHRVANNMAIVASLLNMHQRALPEDEPKSKLVFKEAADRLTAFARIHRRLYNPAAASEHINTLLADLCHDLIEANGAQNIVCMIDSEEDCLPLATLVIVSMALNEAFTNCLKYAFVDRDRGTVSVSFKRRQGSYELLVADDGVGFDAPTTVQGIGSKILDGLAKQLHGSLRVESGSAGTQVRIVFPISGA